MWRVLKGDTNQFFSTVTGSLLCPDVVRRLQKLAVAATLAIIVAGPGIDEIKAKSLKAADIVCRKLKSVRDCDAGSLQICQLARNLMDSQSLGALNAQGSRRRFGRRDIERIDAWPKSSNCARHSRFERVATPTGFQHEDSSVKFEDDEA
jgi:hypothetical protein